MNAPDYARWLVDVTWEDLPEAVQRQTRRCVKDILATAAGSRGLPAYEAMLRLVRAQYGPGPAPLWFSGVDSSLVGACYFNAQVTDSLDCHDGFRPNKGHCGTTMVPVAVAACALREDEVTGTELLTAIAVGYEMASRAGIALHALYAPHYHASGSWAAIGAAAAGAKALRLPAEQVDDVLGMAEYYAPICPMLRCTDHPSIVKDAAGPGAWAGAMALALGIEGQPGLPSLFTEEPLGREQAATVGQDWMILRQYFKPYPVCRWAQPVVEGLRTLRDEHGFTWEDIAAIEVETFANAANLTHFPPSHSDAAQYSLPWAVAVFAVDGEIGVAQVHPSRLNDPRVLEMGRRITTRVAEDIQARFPAEALARTTVRLRDGRELHGPTLGARGDYTNPLSDEELDEKAWALLQTGLGESRAAEVRNLLDSLQDASVRRLLQAL
ncbi:MAG: MmgE/PrpD family protein [Armatimonadetes bacterium]|nr:MmgE/PrpD family protein [Armatimonadota bacterium]